jgi:hypothetical protein
MPAPVVTCMDMLGSPHRRLAYGRCQRKGWHNDPTAWTVRQHGNTAGPRPPVPRSDCHGGYVCRGAAPAALWRGVFPRGSAPDCGDGVAERAPGQPHRCDTRATPARAGSHARDRGSDRACCPRAWARGPTASRRAPQSSGIDPGGPHGCGDAGTPACRGAPGHRPPPGDGRQCTAWPGAARVGPHSARPLWGDGAGARGGALRRRAGQVPGRLCAARIPSSPLWTHSPPLCQAVRRQPLPAREACAMPPCHPCSTTARNARAHGEPRPVSVLSVSLCCGTLHGAPCIEGRQW